MQKQSNLTLITLFIILSSLTVVTAQDETRLSVHTPDTFAISENQANQQTDKDIDIARAIHVFSRQDDTWIQEAYIKASKVDENERFDFDVTFDDLTILTS